MTQESKDLLLKDLCARLPYKVKVQDIYYNSLEPAPVWLIDINTQNVRMFADEGYQSIEYIRPYLFPMSSMTEEQKKEYASLVWFNGLSRGWDSDDAIILDEVPMLTDFYHKNHIDYRGFIPKGLAIDATGLNTDRTCYEIDVLIETKK